jgi:putative protein kinase ArgK-like GTPase of G3E family
VITTEAINNKNSDLLLEKILAHIDYSKKTGRFEKHRREQIRSKIYKILRSHLSTIIKDKLEGIVDLDQIVFDIYQHKSDPYTESERLLELSSLQK